MYHYVTHAALINSCYSLYIVIRSAHKLLTVTMLPPGMSLFYSLINLQNDDKIFVICEYFVYKSLNLGVATEKWYFVDQLSSVSI